MAHISRFRSFICIFQMYNWNFENFRMCARTDIFLAVSVKCFGFTQVNAAIKLKSSKKRKKKHNGRKRTGAASKIQQRFLGSEFLTSLKNVNCLAWKHLCVFLPIHVYHFIFSRSKCVSSGNTQNSWEKVCINFIVFQDLSERNRSQKNAWTVTNKFLFHKTHGECWGSAAWYSCIRANQLQSHNLRLVY